VRRASFVAPALAVTRRLLAGLVLVAAGVVATGRLAAAEPPAPDPGAIVEVLTVSPQSVHAGEVVQVAGRGCEPGERVDISVFSPNRQAAGSLVAGMAGLFGATVRLPPDAQPGRLWIRATCPGADSRPWVMDATLAVRSPAVVITWVNVLFGLGATLAVTGFGLAGRRRTARGKGRHRPDRLVRPRGRLLRRRRRRRTAGRRARVASRP
jgi:hypothetical protein